MINDDTLIKISRQVLGDGIKWPDRVRYMKWHLEELKLGFPGIGSSHLSIILAEQVQVDDIIILDTSLISPSGTTDAPVMLKWLGSDQYFVEGIGKALDLSDTSRLNIRWKDTVSLGILPPLVLRVDVRPTDNGGPGYYYFFKAYRDQRL